ncbi:MAG: T9SS type A sorting domain-containing protein [Candidatus Cloacimonetes bacterium]|nr:T9SS type A sorting domain-containing protein [Candidatus Cloacimonadota bacterium]
MNKVLILVSLLMAINLTGKVEVDFEGEKVSLNGSFAIEEIKELSIAGKIYNQIKLEDCQNGNKFGRSMTPHFTKLLALPDEGNWIVSEFEYETEELKLDHPLAWHGIDEQSQESSNINWAPEDLVTISEPVIMRQIRFSQVSIDAMQYDAIERKVFIIKNFSLILVLDRTRSGNVKYSNGADSGNGISKLASSITGYTGNRDNAKDSYLIICPDIPSIVSTLEYLVNWKRKLGFETTLVTLSETGSTNNEIKEYLQNAYDTWENPPEYIILAGDVTGNITIPSWYVAGSWNPYCVTDHPYALLEGDDYFPDVLIGRLSVQSTSQLQTIVSKIIHYESDPLINNNWTRRALMLSYITTEMLSQRETVMEVRDKLLDFTYTEVDTFFSPYQSGINNLTNVINTGYSFINYRGAGNHFRWYGCQGDMFNIWAVDQLTNGFMLPMITSIVCGGGDFADDDYDTAFGEMWLAAGSSANPKGAIGFIGPSEHDTKTGFNNCNDMGIYQSITQENIFGAAAMMLRGKMELYNNYPGCHSMDGVHDTEDSDMFYFYVYNLLGDPGLQVWTDEPRYYEVQMPEILPQGSSTYEINLVIADGAGHKVALTSDNQLYDVSKTNEYGWASLVIPDSLMEFEVTVSGYGYVPITQAVTISAEEQIIGLSSYVFSSEPVCGATMELTVGLYNYTQSEQSELAVELVTEDELITLNNSIQEIDILPVGSSEELIFEVEFSSVLRDEKESWLNLKINSGELGSHFIPLEIKSAELIFSDRIVMNQENSLLIGDINDLNIKLYNNGDTNCEAFMGILTSLDNKCQITQNNSSYPEISPGDSISSNAAYSISLDNNLITGEPLAFCLEILRDGEPIDEIEFSLAAGCVDESSPTYSEYGYYAIESSDEGNFVTPDYNWIEIAEPEGGSGTMINESYVTRDGFSTCIPLPFEFCYYGILYDEITVSSSGWLAMGNKEQVFFRNRTIPSGAGPSAMIAPYWDYLRWGNIYTYYDQDEHLLIIEWHGFRDDFGYNPQVFEVILYDPLFYPTPTGDGEIKFQYQEVQNLDVEESYATIGIENMRQTEGLLLSFANIYPESMHAIISETAILISVKEGIIPPRMTTGSETLNISLNPDKVEIYELELSNDSDQTSLEYDVTMSHFSCGDETGQPERDISSSLLYLDSDTYITGHETYLRIYLDNSINDEAIHGVEIDFPEDMVITSARNIHYLNYNEQTGAGATVTWGYGNGIDYVSSHEQGFNVFYIVDAGTSTPLNISWRIDGDGSGEEPHSVTGEFTLTLSEDKYIWIEYPNGGEELAYGLTDTIRWNSFGDIENVDVYFKKDYSNIELITGNVPNTGEIEWTIPIELTNTARIRVKETGGVECDDSDDNFSIRELVITYPTSETVMEYNTTEEIRWDSNGNTPIVNIDYSLSEGYIWNTLAEDVPNTGSYQFMVNLSPGDNCKLRITDPDGGLIYEMPEVFSITDIPINWCNIAQNTGTIEPGETENLSIEIDTSGMPLGEYSAYLIIKTNYNQSISIPVNLEVIEQEEENPVPPIAILKGNYPNPFGIKTTRDGDTVIEYDLNINGRVKVAVYNLKGQLIRVIFNDYQDEGNYSLIWNGNNEAGSPVATGVYFYQLEVNNKKVAARKCLMLK